MTDVLTKEQRTYNMSQIRSKNTKPEITLRKLLFARGIRGYRIHYNLPGKPDIVFTKNKIAIFIDGCFWHKCPICFKEPATRKNFWIEKIDNNVLRDKENSEKLTADGWVVFRFWEHEIRKNPEDVVEKILKKLRD